MFHTRKHAIAEKAALKRSGGRALGAASDRLLLSC